MEVLAEGVETNEELACLDSLGCYQYQGYLFSKPVPFESFLKLLD
ncbi:EAL domain-containing protein [Psychromonas sp. KJ10-10]